MAREIADAGIGDTTWGETPSYVDAELRQAISEEIVGFGTIVRYLPGGPSVWSAGVYRILGVAPGEIEASPEGYAAFLCDEDRAASRAEYDAILRERRAGGGVRRIRRRDGELRWVEASARVLDGADGEAYAVLVLLRDVTEAHDARNDLAASEARLRAAQELARVGSIDWIIGEPNGYWSDQIYRILGAEPHAFESSIENFLMRVDPDGRQFVREGLEAMHRTGVGRTVDVRLIGDDGVERVASATTVLTKDANGRVVRQLTTLQDISDRRALETQLRESEAFLAAAQGVANVGSWSHDVQTGANTWSAELYRICGIDRSAAAPSLEWFLEHVVHPEDREAVRTCNEFIFAEGAGEVDYRIRRGDGKMRVFYSRANAIRSPDDAVVRIIGITRDVTEMRATEQALSGYQERLRELAGAVSSAAERERRRLGAELHDGTVQGLGFLRMKLAELRTQPAPRRTAILFDEMFAVLDESIRQTRVLLQELSPQVLYELGFEAAIDWLVEQTRVRHRIDCDVRIEFNTGHLAEEVGVQLYQAVRELLTNVVKHSGAKRATVAIESGDGMLRVSVSDDGIGCDHDFDVVPVGRIGGFGLFSIRERLRLLGGSMTVTPAAESGTCVTLLLPLTNSMTRWPERR